MMTKNALHVVAEPFEVQNNIIEATIYRTETYSTELTTGACQKQHEGIKVLNIHSYWSTHCGRAC